MDKDQRGTYDLTDADRAWAAELVDRAPALTTEQRTRLAVLLRLQ